MSKIIFGFYVLLAAVPSFAKTQIVTCEGKATSGNSYKVNLTIDDSNKGVWAHKGGLRRIEKQKVVLEQFDKNGKSVYNHTEVLTDFLAVPPPADAPGNYAYTASGNQSILIAGFGGKNQIVEINVGRFRGIRFNGADCKVVGSFDPKKDTSENILNDAKKILEDSRRKNPPRQKTIPSETTGAQ